jgi:Ca2+-binding RTX toxin-like protein
MAKVYGTNEHDMLGVWRGWFDRDGVTDGDDTIFGLGGDDWIYGRDGNDFLQGGEGADLLFGGDGIDTANYGDSPTGVYVDLQTGKGQGGTAEGDQLYGIENVTGSWWDDHLIGNLADNVLSGWVGNDDLEGGAGADTLDGGLGVDRAIYSDSPAGVTICLLWGSASGGDAEGDKLISIEKLFGSEFDDGLFGDDGANSLQGYLGNDTLLGFGDDDFLEGSSGYDSLNGGSGNDTLSGGRDGDTMAGGPGADVFVWSSSYLGGQYTAAVFSLRVTLTGRTWMWSWISPLGRTRSTCHKSMPTRRPSAAPLISWTPSPSSASIMPPAASLPPDRRLT